MFFILIFVAYNELKPTIMHPKKTLYKTYNKKENISVQKCRPNKNVLMHHDCARA